MQLLWQPELTEMKDERPLGYPAALLMAEREREREKGVWRWKARTGMLCADFLLYLPYISPYASSSSGLPLPVRSVH